MNSLPIDEFIPQIVNTLKNHQNIVITAAPGAGKTTRLPAALAQEYSGQILVLEPRRMAAVAAASRIAEEQQWKLGEKVGYQVRFANQSNASTKLVFMTEALLAKKIVDDPDLKNIDIIILDEFHERSIHVDLALGLIREMQELGHRIKLVVMSATLNAQKISDFLGQAPIVAVPGKTFPLEIIYSKTPQQLNTQISFYERLEASIFEAIQTSKHDVLVFLPGVGEIQKAFDRLQQPLSRKNILVDILHGSLPLEEQKKVLTRSSQQRVILSTNIAESSVTLDGVNVVVDSGLYKSMRHDYKTGFSRLELSRLSKSSATQRAGRAARQMEGYCFKLWNKMDENSMSEFEAPEIAKIDLSDALLFLASQGITEFKNFSWFEIPPESHLKQSQEFLRDIGAIDNKNSMTALGRRLLRWPLTLRLSRILEESIQLKQQHLGAMICSILQEKDFLIKEAHQNTHEESQSDLIYRLHLFEGYLDQKKTFGVSNLGLQNIKQVYLQLMNLMRTQGKIQWSESDVHALLGAAFRDRLAKRRGKGDKAISSQKRGLTISPQSFNKTAEYFFAIEGADSISSSDTMISICHAVPKEWIYQNYHHEIVKKDDVYLDEVKGSYFQKEQRLFRELVLEEAPPKVLPPERMKELLPQICLQRHEWIFKENTSLSTFEQKMRFLAFHKSLVSNQVQTEIDEILSSEFNNHWLENLFNDLCVGEVNIHNIVQKDCSWILQQHVSTELSNLLEQKLPSFLLVPSGSKIKIQYPTEKNPFIEVRIQEIFGWSEVPKILNVLPITIHLLGPNYRPVQLTSDLQSFWKNGYPEVRKELRIKYPKHQWPENPDDGIAEAKGRPRH